MMSMRKNGHIHVRVRALGLRCSKALGNPIRFQIMQTLAERQMCMHL